MKVSRKKTYIVEMTEDQAKALGILVCESCGYPPNNHFDFEPFKCAHDPECTGLKPVIRLP